jgi:membrane-bound lytic murein transglycosylase D
LSVLQFRRVFLATLITGSALLSACAGTPPTAQAPTQTVVVPTAPVAATRPAEVASASKSAELIDTALAVAQAQATSETPPAAVPEPYADIFERIRAGFQLEDPEQRAIDIQAAWYVSHPDYLERTFGRGELYIHYVVSQLEARKMPLELALLPVVESAFEPFGYSRARAAGLWQFIAGTGQRFGLKQNWWYDGRRDVVESTRAALDYLEFLHQEFNGDWLLAVAAYNCGEFNVQRAIDRNLAAGKPTDFWHLRLPKETRAYVPKLLAMRRIVEFPGDYGLEFTPIPNQPYFATVDTGGQIDLKLASELAGITHDELADLNPAFMRWATDPEGPHQLLVPAESGELFLQSLAQVPLEDRVRTKVYEVGAGETLTQVAQRTGTSASVIKQINGLTSTKLRAGQELRIPESSALPAKVALAAARVDRPGSQASRGRFHVVRRGESLSTIARRHGVSVNTLAAWNGMEPGDTLRAGRKITVRSGGNRAAQGKVATNGTHTSYTVRRGDTLSHIAHRFSVTVSQLLSWNGLSKSTLLKPGQRLTVRRS